MSDAFEQIDKKFRSGNSIPVDRAVVTADEWNELRARLDSPANTVTDNSAVIERLERERDELRESNEALAAHCDNVQELEESNHGLQLKLDEALAWGERLREAADKVKHWHDTKNDGMIVSAHAVMGLWSALNETPQTSLREIRAEAGREGFKAGADWYDRTKMKYLTPHGMKTEKEYAANEYADQIRRGVKMSNDREKGLYTKYNVSRVDGRPMQDAIVLEFKDPNARAGIKAFSEAVRADGYNHLADDIDLRLEEYGGENER